MKTRSALDIGQNDRSGKSINKQTSLDDVELLKDVPRHDMKNFKLQLTEQSSGI